MENSGSRSQTGRRETEGFASPLAVLAATLLGTLSATALVVYLALSSIE